MAGKRLTVYTIAKAALEGLTKAMAADPGGENVRVNSIVVGMIWKECVNAWADEEVQERKWRTYFLSIYQT